MNSKNLFMESLSHLGVAKLPDKTTPIPEDIPSELPEKQVDPDIIFLGRGKSFKDTEEAYQYLLSLPLKELPAKYRNSLTQSFFKGTEEGQINTLFKDWKQYREKIHPKIKEFFEHIRLNPSKCSFFMKYVNYLQKNLLPTNKETYLDNCLDLSYFKFWCLFKNFNENRSNLSRGT